ncbi:hypothetical protein [Peteryoungia ipomoeae]|uniref:Uncharacterized protein n=1 Tax=Peteryoungia ipomoeae TaxID=1210932 RepID=A0A4S8NZ05_9HYPH|nr:hypothetical protein [Peteryoungia ipomoeae]THV21622.1 hypothetical protein FAA97_16575 [Peteryoungia ipomoeae]
MQYAITAFTCLIFALTAALPVSAAHAPEQSAIDGCIDRIRGEGGGKGGEVLRSDDHEAGHLIVLKDPGGTVWRCLAERDGKVRTLAIGKTARYVHVSNGLTTASIAAPGGIIEIRIPEGETGTIVNGRISGREHFDYTLGASEAQTLEAALHVDQTNGNGSIYFNVLPPGSADVAIFNGATSIDGKASIKLPVSGAYRLRVYLMGEDRDLGKSVGYRLNVSVR